MKKIIIIVISILILGIGGYFLWDKVINKKEPKNNNTQGNESYEPPRATTEEVTEDGKTIVSGKILSKQNEVYTYSFEQLENEFSKFKTITFSKGDNIVSTYACGGAKCQMISFDSTVKDRTAYIIGDTVLFAVVDGEKSESYSENGGFIGESKVADGVHTVMPGSGTLVLYDVTTGKEVTSIADVEITYQTVFMKKNIKLLKFTNGTYKFLTNTGVIDITYEEDSLTLSCYEGCLLDNDTFTDKLIVVKKNDKYGIQSFSDGTTILNNEYDAIWLFRVEDVEKTRASGAYTQVDINYFKAKKDNAYNLYSLEDMSQVTTQGYDDIFMITNDVFMAYKDKYISFKNIDETDYIEDKIYVENIQPAMPKIKNGVRIVVDGNTATIIISDGGWNGTMLQYTLDLKTKKLTKEDKASI